MLRLNVETSFRAAGYAAILLIGVLSLVPGTLRPETGAPGQFEHFVAYLGAAALLALGSDKASRRWQGFVARPVRGRFGNRSTFRSRTPFAIFGLCGQLGRSSSWNHRRIRGCAYFVNDARRADRSDKQARVRAARRPSLWDDLTAMG